jgi:uncharacterized protein (TIGR03435 family)
MSPLALLALAIAIALPLQSAQALRFEVASLKPAQQGVLPMTHAAPGGERFLANGATLKDLIRSAYGVVADQITGGPDWIAKDQFDMEAKAERASSLEELHAMLQSLLEERFQLRFRTETRELPVYLLSVDKEAPKMTPHEPLDAGEPIVRVWVDAPLHIRAEGTAASMEYLARSLRPYTDRPMVDRTGLKGGYDFRLVYTMQPPVSMAPGTVGHDGQAIDFTGPSIVQAMRQQMGLRLEAGKGPLPIMVVENAVKPAAN